MMRQDTHAVSAAQHAHAAAGRSVNGFGIGLALDAWIGNIDWCLRGRSARS
jgi:hypothetical protein